MTTDLRVIVSGSRDWSDDLWIRMDMANLLYHADRMGRRLVLVHGDHWSGADHHVQVWADARPDAVRFGYLKVERYPADWSLGSGAGPQRNQRMVDLGADLCLAYPKGVSRGTRGCARKALRARIPTLVTEYGPGVVVTLEERLRRQGIRVLEGGR